MKSLTITMYNKQQSPSIAAIINIDGKEFIETNHDLDYFELRNKYETIYKNKL